MRNQQPPIVVTFAGTDPSGGAGVQADIKAISATGSYAASIMTALVAQNTQSVLSIFDIPALFIEEQIEAVFSDLKVAAIKIGMLNRKEVIDVIATALDRFMIRQVVLDPVMIAKNGAALLQPEMVSYLMTRLFPYCRLITPNIPEANCLLGTSIENFNDMAEAAQTLGQRLGIDVLVKGGHLAHEEARDVLYQAATGQHHWFSTKKITTRNTHGTGCTYSAAIASYLAQGFELIDAVNQAKNYLTAAITSGSHHAIGQGHGPVDHFFYLDTYAKIW